MPPSDASAPGSIGKNRPVCLISSLSCLRVTPACTVTVRSSALTREHAVHARQVDADAALHREQVALERRADAERDHRHRVRGGERDDGGDVLGALAEHHRLGRRHVERRLVAAVLLAHRQRGRAALAEARLQRLEHRRRHRAAARACGSRWAGSGAFMAVSSAAGTVGIVGPVEPVRRPRC